MARIGFVTDSTAHIPEDLVAKYDIRIADLTVQFGQQSFREHAELTAEDFFRRLKEARTLPTTSQPSPESFVNIYRDLAKDHDSIIVDVLSEKLSGTINSARLAADLVKDTGVPITVIDSVSAWMGTGVQVLAGAQAAAAGKSHDECVAVMERIIPREQVMLVVDTLEYIQRGGRIGRAQAMVGTLLQVKPLLALREGVVQPVERVRTKRKAIERMVDIMADHVRDQPYTAVVGHALAESEGQQLREMILHRIPQCRHMYFSPVSPVIAVHLGPGALGLVYYVEPPDQE